MKRKDNKYDHIKNQSHGIKIKVEVKNAKNVKLFDFQLPLHSQMKQANRILQSHKNSLESNNQKLIGFQTISNDPLTDFCLYKQIGNIRADLHLRPLYNDSKLQGLNQYRLLKCLATGGFSKVYLARSLINGQFYAAKFVDKVKVPTQDKKVLILNQQKVNEIIDYPFLVKMHEFIQTQNFYVFIMDYCPGGQLFYLLRKVKRMTEEQARIYFVQIILGIQYLHKQGIMYRDLKPQNIMIDQTGHVKIADFGLAKFYKEKSYSFCGSIEYMSPEIVTNAGHSFQVDYYCLGALLFELLIGCPPFYDPQLSQYQTKKNIAYSQVQFPDDFGLSNEVKDLIEKLLIKNPKQRLGHFGGAKQIMLHPWIGKFNRNFIESKRFDVPFPPNLGTFNFDPDEVGMSQQRFTSKIENQYRLINAQKMRKHKKQKKQSLEKIQQLKEKCKSPYSKKNSQSLKKISREQKHRGSLTNLINNTKMNGTLSNFKYLINKEIKRNSSKQNLTKNKSPSFMSVSKEKQKKQNIKKLFKMHFYIPNKLENIKTQPMQNYNSYSISSNKLIKKKKLITQSNDFMKDISNQCSKNKNFSKKNQNSKNIMMDKKQIISHLQNQKSQKSNLLKKSSKLKIKKFFNQNHQKPMNQYQIPTNQNQRLISQKPMNQYGKQLRQTCMI